MTDFKKENSICYTDDCAFYDSGHCKKGHNSSNDVMRCLQYILKNSREDYKNQVEQRFNIGDNIQVNQIDKGVITAFYQNIVLISIEKKGGAIIHRSFTYTDIINNQYVRSQEMKYNRKKQEKIKEKRNVLKNIYREYDLAHLFDTNCISKKQMKE